MRIGWIAATAAFGLLASSAASAATVDWTQWNTAATVSGPTAGAAAGVSGAIGVTYSGELQNLFIGYPTWGPAGTFNGGTVDNAPPSSGGIIQLVGGQGTGPDTITFSAAVLNPVMAIWSLGQGGDPTRFVFTTSNISLEAGGPSTEYGGSSITVSGATVTGIEGNGVIQFNGLVKSISWSNPDSEYWYGFTVGTPGVAAGGVPEPAAWALMIAGFGGAGAALRRRRLAQA